MLHRISSNIAKVLPQSYQRSHHTNDANAVGGICRSAEVVAGHHYVQDAPQKFNRFVSDFFLALKLVLLFAQTMEAFIVLWTFLDYCHQFHEVLRCSEQILKQIHQHAFGLIFGSQPFRSYFQLSQNNQMVSQVKKHLTYTFKHFHCFGQFHLAILTPQKLLLNIFEFNQHLNPRQKSQPLPSPPYLRIHRISITLNEMFLGVQGSVLDYSKHLNDRGSTLSRDYVLLRRARKMFRYYITGIGNYKIGWQRIQKVRNLQVIGNWLELGNNKYQWYSDNQIIININWDKAMLTRIILSYAKIAKQNPSFAFATTSKPKTGKADPPKPQSKTQPEPQVKPKSEPQVKTKSEPQVKTKSEPQKPAQPQPQSPPEEPLQRRRKTDDDYDEQQPQLQKQNRNTVGWWIYRFFFWGTFSLLSYNIYLVHTHKLKTPVEDLPGAVPGVIDVAKSMVRSVNDMLEFISEPTSKKLLFDPVHPDLHPKTLILNLTGTIIKSQYIFGKGIKTTLRPGLEQMLRRLSQKYEIVIFAEEDQYTIMSKIMKIDPKQMHIRGVLGREAMVWKNGQFIKDLKYLNRDLKKVVVVDRTIDNVKNHPQNTIVLKQFDGDDKDNELIKLAVLLDKMADVPDVRKYLKTLGDNPVETYYTRAKEVQERINKKANMFGVFAKPQ